MATAAILNLFNTPKATTHYSGYSYKVSWSLMKGIQNYFKSPLFCFHGNCGKVCPTDSDFIGLSRSTSCACCSYQVSSISVWRVTCYDHFCVFQFFSHFGFKMAAISTKRWISIRNIIIYLEGKFCPNRRIFVFWRPFWIQNGRHSKPKWSPYGAACLTPCKYPFPLKSFHFWIFNNLFRFF